METTPWTFLLETYTRYQKFSKKLSKRVNAQTSSNIIATRSNETLRATDIGSPRKFSRKPDNGETLGYL